MEVKIGNLSAKSGDKIQDYYQGDGFEIPVTIICGKKEGKTVFITSGFHGSEYDGIKVGIEIAEELTPSDIIGNLVIANAVNLKGFYSRKADKNPTDTENVYTSFPGKQDGTESEKIAYSITNDFLTVADYFIDLHGGNMFERVTAFTYYAGNRDVQDASKSMAKAVNTKYMVKAKIESGALNQAGKMGIPSIIIERGGSGTLNFRNVKTYKRDVMNVLKTVGTIDGKADGHRPFNITESDYVNSERNGCYMECFSAGDYIKKGDILGYTTDMFGKVVETHKAPYDGVILFQIDTYACEKDKPLYAIGKLRAI